MRGVNLFGRTNKSSKGAATTTPGRVTAAVPTTPEQQHQRGGQTAVSHCGGSTQQPRQAAAPPGNAPPQRPPKRVESPPALPLPLTPEPRLLRLFPEYEAYDDAVDRQYYHHQQHHQPQQQKPQQQQPNGHPQSHSASAAPVLPIKQEVKLPDGEKGLENNQGQYNCFINVVIQALWHLTAFRERFVRGGSGGHDHCCPGPDTCVHCALQAIFVEYQFSEQAIIPPTALRQSLAVLYKDESRFQMNQIDDAAEALEAILDRLHHTERAQKDKNADPAALEKKACPCLVHNAFGVRTMDLLRCDTCSATTEPKATSLFVAYAYTYALREARAKAGNENGEGNNGSSYSFCQFFQRAAQEDRRWCPNAARCNKMCVVEHHLLYLPKVFSVGLVWPSVEGAPVDEIAEVMDMITMQIDLSNIFITNTAIGRYLQQEKKSHATAGTSGSLHDSLLGSGVFDSIALDAVPGGDGEQSTTANGNANAGKRQRGKRVKCVYELRGMICYYGQHYNCYFNSPATGQWYVFDDVMVNAVGSTWAAVKERCLRGHLQPSVLFYEKKEVLEVDVAEDDDDEGEEDEMPADDHQLPVPTTAATSLPARDAHVAAAKAAHAAAAGDDDDDGGQKEAIARAAREVEEGGMEALKRTIGAEILELLLQGEEQWKKERERERELDRVRQSEERSRAAQAQAQAAAAVDQEHDHHEEEEEEQEVEEVGDGTAMNRSWFVRTPEDDQAAEAAEAEEEGGGEEKRGEREEGDTKTEPSTPLSGHARAIAGDEAAPQRVAAAVATAARRSSTGSSSSSSSSSSSTGHGAAAAKRIVPQLRSEEVEEDSEWEIIDSHGDDDDHHDDFTSIHAPGRRRSRGHTRTDGEEEEEVDDDGDDVEIIFENERERPERDDECDAERKTKSARAANENEQEDDDDVEIVDETEGGRRDRIGSAFAVLSTSGSASSDLDISFTMLDRPHGDGDVGEVRDGSAPLEVTVTRTSWLYIDGEGVERIAQLLCLHNSDIALTRQ